MNTKFEKFARFFHAWCIPLLHALLWGIALYFAQNATDILGTENQSVLSTAQFGAVFLVLFLEIVIVLLDAYVNYKAHDLASGFIIFVVLLLSVLVFTVVSVFLSIIKGENGNWGAAAVLWVIAFSSALKFLEVLLSNNIERWYIVPTPTTFDARGRYVRRQLGIGR